MEGAAPYMEEHYKGRDLLEDKGTLEALSKYLHKEKRFTSDMYDIAVGMTKYVMIAFSCFNNYKAIPNERIIKIIAA